MPFGHDDMDRVFDPVDEMIRLTTTVNDLLSLKAVHDDLVAEAAALTSDAESFDREGLRRTRVYKYSEEQRSAVMTLVTIKHRPALHDLTLRKLVGLQDVIAQISDPAEHLQALKKPRKSGVRYEDLAQDYLRRAVRPGPYEVNLYSRVHGLSRNWGTHLVAEMAGRIDDGQDHRGIFQALYRLAHDIEEDLRSVNSGLEKFIEQARAVLHVESGGSLPPYLQAAVNKALAPVREDSEVALSFAFRVLEELGVVDDVPRRPSLLLADAAALDLPDEPAFRTAVQQAGRSYLAVERVEIGLAKLQRLYEQQAGVDEATRAELHVAEAIGLLEAEERVQRTELDAAVRSVRDLAEAIHAELQQRGRIEM